jgi:hypothetical protein
MLTLCKSAVLGAAFLAGVAIAANADPLCRTPTGPCGPGPTMVAAPSASVEPANEGPKQVLSYYDLYTGPYGPCAKPCHSRPSYPIR